MGDAGLGVLLLVIEDRDARSLAPRPRRRGDRDQGLEWCRHRDPTADGSVHVVEEVRGVRRVQVRGLGRVDRAAPTDRHERVEAAATREVGRGSEARVLGLDEHPVEELVPDPVLLQGGRHRRPDGGIHQGRIDDQHGPPSAHVHEVHPDLARHPLAEADVRSGHLEGSVVLHAPDVSG